jgi:hypothetical protein
VNLIYGTNSQAFKSSHKSFEAILAFKIELFYLLNRKGQENKLYFLIKFFQS